MCVREKDRDAHTHAHTYLRDARTVHAESLQDPAAGTDGVDKSLRQRILSHDLHHIERAGAVVVDGSGGG